MITLGDEENLKDFFDHDFMFFRCEMTFYSPILMFVLTFYFIEMMALEVLF